MFGHVPEVGLMTILVNQKYVSKQTVIAFAAHVPLSVTSSEDNCSQKNIGQNSPNQWRQ